jgi:Bacterial extracellular solute-binding proteins, family 5 Middle
VARRGLAWVGAAVILASVLTPRLAHGATLVGDNSRTITVSLPGPFTGCSVLDAGATPTTSAVLDLVRPSAFQTTPNGNLVGEGGPLATAELTSLSPETVVYSITPHQTWSNGLTFNGSDLVAWWQRARAVPGVVSDGYRDIQSLSVGSNGLTVTAIFATPYADWSLLFRDVEARGTTPGCAIGNLVARPSLGPYRVVSAGAHRIVLAMNPKWPLDPSRFGRVVIVDGGAIPATSATPFAAYSLAVTRANVASISAHPWVASRIATSSNVLVMTYSPTRPFTSSLTMRKALSWSISRQGVINRLWGSITFSPSVAASAIYSQGQNAYPGTGGTTPSTPTTVAPTTIPEDNGLADCLPCALAELSDAGFHRVGRHWVNAARQTLRLRVVTGPSALDRSSAAAVVAQWAALGIGATLTHAASDQAAALAAATNHDDVAFFAKPTTSAASVAARSWSGTPFPDTFPSGFRSTGVAALFASAISNFNGAGATTTWLKLDQAVLRAYWIRPLFTAPSLVEWNNSLVGVSGSNSLAGFIDQLTGWNTAPPSSG